MEEETKPAIQTLGRFLANLRATKGLSLRQVEENCRGIVSNAYLSQLENGRIGKPSPNILHALAEVYGIPYETLMAKAGYITKTNSETRSIGRHGRIPTLAKEDLTPEEEEAVLEYIAFLKSRKGRQSS